jgi:hypothetical protein
LALRRLVLRRFVTLRLGERLVVFLARALVRPAVVPFRPRFVVRRELVELALFFDLRDRLGTLPPARRASDRPMATACFRLVTFLPDLPERNLPRFISCIARSTFWLDLGP